MSDSGFKYRKNFESAATRYRALLAKTRDPGRRKMLEEMIENELAAGAAAAERLQTDPLNR